MSSALRGVESTNQVTTMLPYLGPEIIAFIQEATRSAPNDSRPGRRFLRQDENMIILSLTSSFGMKDSDSKIQAASQTRFTLPL
jgi:hypothetical protein